MEFILALLFSFSHQEQVDRDARRHVMSDLEEYTEYSFRLVAVNANGEGVSTGDVAARTYSAVPSDTPMNFTLETASSTVSFCLVFTASKSRLINNLYVN